MRRHDSNGKAPTARLQRRGSDGEAPTAWLQRRGYDVRRLFEPKWLRESVVHGMMSLSVFTTASALVPLSSVMRPLPHPPQIVDRTRVAGSCYIFNPCNCEPPWGWQHVTYPTKGWYPKSQNPKISKSKIQNPKIKKSKIKT